MGGPPAIRPVPAFAGAHAPRPLGFDPSRCDGLSGKLLLSHWENNYVASVNALNLVERDLDAALRDVDFPPVLYAGLKREELSRTGSIVLHDFYFGNLGGDGLPVGTIVAALASTFGTFANWEAEFRRTGLSLAGGSGWCVLVYNLHTRTLRNHWASDHTQAIAAGVPLLVLDMYEHAYQIDYGASAAKYVEAFMRNIDWHEVERRHVRVLAAPS
jgi:Fe-Mn family superoxide dismutase